MSHKRPQRPPASPRSRSAPPGSRWGAHLPLAVVLLVAFAVYANAIPHGFLLLDDELQVVRNPWIRDWSHLPDIFTRDVWSFQHGRSVSNYYRPLMHVIFLVIAQIFGMRPWSFHLANVAFHVANSGLVFLLVRRWMTAAGQPDDRRLAAGFLSVGFVAAILFATHPAHTEAVAWISSIPELAFSFFALSSFLLYVRSDGRTVAELVPSVALFCLSLLCKETAVTLPALLIVHDVAFRRGGQSWSGRLRRWAPYLAAVVVYLLVRSLVLSHAVSRTAYTRLGPDQLVLNLFPLFAEYVRTLVLPTRLHYWHTFHPLDSLVNVEGLVSVAVAAAFLIGAIVAWKRHRLSFFALALFAIPLAPAFLISALPAKPFAERYAYLPSVGFALLAALGFRSLRAVPRLRGAAVVVLVAIVVLYSAGTVARNTVWKDFYTLYADTMRKSPDAPVPCDDLAAALFGAGRIDEAIVEFTEQVRVNANNASCQASLGSALLLKGRLDDAVQHLQKALTLDPNYLPAYNDLGVALNKQGRRAEAIEQYHKALALDPEYPDVHFSLAGALADSGRMEEALEHYRTAVRLRPENAYYRNALGIEYGKQGRRDEAIAQFRECVRRAPDEVAYRRNLERAEAMPQPSAPTGP